MHKATTMVRLNQIQLERRIFEFDINSRGLGFHFQVQVSSWVYRHLNSLFVSNACYDAIFFSFVKIENSISQ